MPTENGTPIHAGRRPTRDAAVIERLRAAGAVILGKTVTTELRRLSPGQDAQPHDPERTPGGSSSGSAAAVAAGMVPLAVGLPDQWLGDPSGELLRRVRLQAVARPDLALWRARPVTAARHIGVFARTLEDLALIAEPLIGFDARDRDTRLETAPRLLEVARQDWPLAPDLALVKSSSGTRPRTT